MKKSQIFLSIIAFAIIFYGVDVYRMKKTPCYEIVQMKEVGMDDILLNKCTGRTWALVHTETFLSDLGYIGEEGDKKINTMVWTNVEKAGGVLTLKSDKE
ncbi:MAG: hypothetical protein H6867_01190 [Rhodospirillales bacterium]|nr:hypothetical protein [Rhodospirillales bacterium]MCB9997130.1 hypothetical protein [Rhodospirillales bacterium]